MSQGKAASWSPSYPASWSPGSGKAQGDSGFAPDPTYPTVTGTQEAKWEADALPALTTQVSSWVDDWNSHDIGRVAGADCVVADGVFADEKHVAWSGQGEPLFVDRGAALTLRAGLTFFQVIETGTISGQAAHANIFQCSRGDALSRMSMVQRNAAGNFLSWWDETAGWMESSTSLADDTKYILSWRSDNTSMKLAINGGAEEAIGNPTHQQMEFYNIASSTAATEPFIGNHSAVIVYTSELSDADRILVRNYLNAKYVVY